ncbi:phage tail length tape measure family protein [Sphingomonas sp. PsM26]|nr:phage tail length tape measure family protein [Sphingomonas sp. PsM26]
MNDGAPSLEVGFQIETGSSFNEVQRLQAVMESAEGKVLAAAAQIERATSGMVGQAATANVVAFGNAATRAGVDAARALRAAETAGEGLSRSMERQIANFGKTKDEIRAARVEVAALAAAEQGLTELSGRLQAQNTALEAQAQSSRSAALAYNMFEAAAHKGAAAMREADAAAASSALEKKAQELRSASLAYNMFEAAARKGGEALREEEAAQGRSQAAAAAAATKRLADEHERLAAMVRGSHDAQMADVAAAERLRSSTDPLYAATKRLNAEMEESTRLYRAGATAPVEYARQQSVLTARLTEAAKQHDAVAVSARKSGFALRQFALQMPDIIQGLLTGQKPMTVFIQQGGQIAQVGMMAEGGLKGFAGQLGAVALRFAPLALGAAGAVAAFALFDRAVTSGVNTKDLIGQLGLTHAEIKRLKDTTVTSGDVIKATFQVMAERVGLHLGNMSKWFGQTMDYMTRLGRDAMAGLYAGIVGTFDAISIAARDIKAGKGIGDILSDVDRNMSARFNQARGALNKFGTDVTKQIASNKLKDLQKQANEIKADRTPKKDTHAEQLARDAAAIEAQIRNLYALADAYDVSGAAALIAEARVKAESQAIRKRGDIEAAVARQVSLAIGQRVADAAKGTAAMREQADAQDRVNAAVAAGTVPAARAAELLRDRLADLPLLAAMEAANATGNAAAASRAADALDRQRAARDRLTDSETKARYLSAMATGADQLAIQREELRLVGATDEARVRALATLRATQEARDFTGKDGAAYVAQQVEIALATERTAAATRDLNGSLSFTADRWDMIARNVQTAAQGMADAFGNVGRAIGDMASVYTNYEADRARLAQQRDAEIKASGGLQSSIDRANQRFALASATSQVGAYGDMAQAAKGFFDEKSKGYQTMLAAEKVFRAVEFALSVKAMAQDAIHTASSVGKSAIRAAASGVEAVAKAIASLPFPANIAAGAATVAALAAIGVSVAGGLGGGGKSNVVKANDGTGTVLGDSSAKSDSIKNAIDALKEVDTLTNTFARQMAASLRSIDSQIGNVASLVSRAGDVNASAGVTEGFKSNLLGSVLGKIPLIGGLLGSLFGSTTTVTGNGLYGGAQSVGSILGGGFDAKYYSDIQKKSKFLGITTGTKNSTQYSGANATLANQFTLILRQFNDAIVSAAGPLGSATGEIQNRLNGFIVNIGKIDLKGLTGTEIQEKLSAVFGAAADNMANAAFPGIERFQKVGEGAFETLVRVASTVEAVTNAMDQLGSGARGLGIDAKVGLAAQFDTLSDLTSAVDGYFQAFYSSEEQAAAKQAQLARVFGSLNVAMPGTLAAFRALVEAQDLNTAAGQSTYATLLQLAPAFADLQKSMEGAKSAADIASERNDLQRQILQLQGNTAAIRALDLAKIDSSNRALQEQVWAIQDAQDAAKAADELRAAWTSVGDSIMDEVKRIRGLTGTNGGTSFASLMGQFNAATAAARGGDQDAAKSLPQLSQAMLSAAALVATSRQELDRVQAQTAASLEATNAAIGSLANSVTPDRSLAVLLADAAATQAGAKPTAANDDMTVAFRVLRDELAQLRADTNAGNAAIAGNTGSIKRVLDNVTADSQGTAISVASAAA